MRKFVFKLDPILKQRQRLEEIAQKNFAEAMAELKTVQQKILRKQEEINTCFDLSPMVNNNRVDVNRLVENRRFVEHMYIELQELNEERVQKETIASHKQHFLMTAAKEKESMKRFKEKKKESWQKEMLAEEQRNLDEVGLQMSQRSVWR